MAKNFSKHHEIINYFRGEVNKKSFENRYRAKTEHLNTTEQFLLKTELNRLASPCTRSIDLRGLVRSECQLFDFQGLAHYLDEEAIALFNESVAHYGDYTFGVYETVNDAKNSFRDIYDNEEIIFSDKKIGTEKLQYSAQLHLLTNYPNRVEERVDFSIPITLKLANKQTLKASSIDLSVTGIKFKLINKTALFEGDVLTITLTGLDPELQFSKDSLLSFEVKKVSRDSGVQIIGCQRINIPEQDAFEHFLIGYTKDSDTTYKINLDNTLAALQARSLEQYALVKLNELPIFMHCVKGDNVNIAPRYVLTTQNNQKIYHYWQDKKNKSAIQALINAERFQRLLNKKNQDCSLLVFSFTRVYKGIKFFYSLDEDQLPHDNTFFRQFLSFAASKDTFAVTALNCQSINIEQAHSPFTLSTAMTKRQTYLNPPLTDEVKEILATLPYVVTATDVSDTTAVSDYQNQRHVGIDLERLKRFGYKSDENNCVDEITLSYGHQRQEARFIHKTPIIIECGSLKFSAQSEDFSVSGVRVSLEKPTMLSQGDIAYLSFPKLQKMTSAFELKQLPYQVMRVSQDKKEVNFRVSVKEQDHIGKSFFKLLIEKNKNKLTSDEYAMLTPGLSEALRTLYSVNMAITTAIVQSSGSQYKIETLVAGKYGSQSQTNFLSAMLRLSERHGYYNLYPLLGNSQARERFNHYMKKLLASDSPISERMYIAIKDNVTDIENEVTIKLMNELATTEMRYNFIKSALKQGDFYSIQLTLSRSDEANMEHLNPELDYISSYARHRGKQLEQYIHSVVGVVQLIDVTQETLFRHVLPVNP
ncbi:MAG: PilZ domain-containing protein [Colwellia sp.]